MRVEQNLPRPSTRPGSAESAELSTPAVDMKRLDVFVAQYDGCNGRLMPTSAQLCAVRRVWQLARILQFLAD